MHKPFYFFLSTLFTMQAVAAEPSKLSATLQEHLTAQLDDASLAQQLTTIIISDTLQWKAPKIPIKKIDTIIAYAFGNRILPNGNHMPGPTNKTLADLVVSLYQKTKVHVYAQWEVAQALGKRIPTEKVTVIYPTFDVQGNTVYLSTAGVASAIVTQVGNPKKLGKTAIVAFNDHMYRCVSTSRESGIDAYAPENYSMPNVYDAQSGQPWTRNRLAYLVTDIKVRISNLCTKLTTQ